MKKELFAAVYQPLYDEIKDEFIYLGKKGCKRYTTEQKLYSFDLIKKYGVRATARILPVSRRTLQRWCRKYNVYVQRCPAWVYEWAAQRRRRREFWERRGHF